MSSSTRISLIRLLVVVMVLVVALSHLWVWDYNGLKSSKCLCAKSSQQGVLNRSNIVNTLQDKLDSGLVFGLPAVKKINTSNPQIKIVPQHVTSKLPVTKYITAAKNQSSHVLKLPSKVIRDRFVEFVSADERMQMADTLRVLTSTFIKSRVTYFAIGGTYIGALRHHGFVPWDDDMDVCCFASDKDKIKRILLKMNDFTVLFKANYKWKFYPKNGKKTRYKWLWPFVDIYFMSFIGNSVHWKTDLNAPTHLKTDIFPLQLRPFVDFSMPVPCKSLDILSSINVNLDQCISTWWNHRLEKKITSYKIPCSQLSHLLAIVRRHSDGKKSVEHLMMNGTVLSSFVSSPPCT